MLRVDSTVKENIIKTSGLTENQYEYHLRLGKRWREICGKFDGILCFIPVEKNNPFRVTPAQNVTLDDQQLEVFHRCLDDDYTHALCIAGKAFTHSLASDVHFAWETKRLSGPVFDLAEADMLQNIKPVVSLTEDEYCSVDYPVWQNPTILLPSTTQCDFCPVQSCDCYSSFVSNAKPRIKRYRGKGLGLQAVSARPGTIVYPRHKLIGFLTGKLVPPGSCTHDRAVDFVQSQIDCSDRGNEFRLLNHACQKHAVAQLRIKRVSGRYRMAVIAQKKIYNGAEITISYNSGEQLHSCGLCQQAE